MEEKAQGFTFPLAQVSVMGGNVSPIRSPLPDMELLNVSPDGSELLAAYEPGTTAEGPLWALPILGGSPRQLAGTVGHAAAWSPDKNELFYTKGDDLYLASGDETDSRKIASLLGRASWPAWSPGGCAAAIRAPWC